MVRPWDKDRYMSPDILASTKLLKSEKIWNAVKGHMESYHSKQVKAHFFRILQIFDKGILFFMTDYWDEGVQSNQLHIRVFLATSRTDWWRRWRKYQQYRRIKGFGRKVCSLLTVFSFFFKQIAEQWISHLRSNNDLYCQSSSMITHGFLVVQSCIK